MKTGSKIMGATLVIFIFTLLSRFLGLGREMAIAYSFGATGETDAFMLALTIPNIFHSVVGIALATAVIPIFEEYRVQGRREEIWQVLSTAVNVIIVVIGLFVLLGAVGSSAIVRVLGPGFPAETAQLAINLTAIVMPSILFTTLAGVLGGILNANHIFGPVAIGPAVLNLAIIVSALVSFPRLGIYNLAIGTVVGSLLYVAVQVPALRRVGFKYSLAFNIQNPAVSEMLKMMGPILIVTGISQIYTMVDLRFASNLEAGSIAVLNYARKLMQLPQGLFVAAITTAIFPMLSKLAAEGKNLEMAAVLQKAMRGILLLAIPGSMGLIILRNPIVALLFERGAFDLQATARTAEALFFYSLGLFSLCLYLPLTRAFFALKDTSTPLLILCSTVGLKALFSFVLVKSLLHCGLALATSLTVMINVVVLSLILYRRMPKLFNSSFFNFICKSIIAASIMGLVIYGLDIFLIAHFRTDGLMLAMRVVFDIAVGVITFLTVGLALKMDEVRYLINLPRKIVNKSKFSENI